MLTFEQINTVCNAHILTRFGSAKAGSELSMSLGLPLLWLALRAKSALLIKLCSFLKFVNSERHSSFENIISTKMDNITGFEIKDGEYTKTIYNLIKEQRYNEAIQILSFIYDSHPTSRAALSLLAYCYFYTQVSQMY